MPKRQGILAKLRKGLLYLQTFKPIIAARCQVTMKTIVCAIEGVEMLIRINVAGRDEVMFIKTLKT